MSLPFLISLPVRSTRLAQLLLTFVLTVAPPVAAQAPKTLLHSFLSPGPSKFDIFGNSVTVAGQWVVVGAHQNNTGGQDSGVAYIYDMASPMPTVPVLTLTNPIPMAFTYFGYPVAALGTRVVVGTYGTGTTHLYDLASATPAVPAATLTNPAPPASRFGSALSVAMHGARLVVGRSRNSVGAYESGVAYLFDLDSATPALPVLTITNPSPADSDQFGTAVAISGSKVAISAPRDDTGAMDSGVAYVYDLDGATPTVPVLTLTNPSPRIGEGFGGPLAISGKWLVIGEWHDTIYGRSPGSAYVFDLDSTVPTVPAFTLRKPGPATNDDFGSAVAITGPRLVIGAPDTFQSGVTNTGIAFVYDLSSATPTEPVATLANPGPRTDDLFGARLAMDGDTIVVGAPFIYDTILPDRGAAYIFGPRPRLQMIAASPATANISWTPSTSSGFVLQYRDSLTPTNWLNAPSGAANPVTVPVTNASRFYRLLQP